MILTIDNYDSFTYNLVQGLGALGADVKVVRNDEIDVAGIEALAPEAILFSPGPGNPDSAGVTLEAIRAFAGKVPLFGVCLGHQSIAQAFGGKIIRAKRLMHGKTSRIRHDGRGLFAGLDQGFEAMRYHSLAVERATLPDCFEITAESEDGEIMGLRHKTLPIESVQYHPESIGTPQGARQLANLIGLAFLLLGIHLPGSLEKPISEFSGLTTPMALFVLGGTLHFSAIRANRRYLWPAITIKLVALPLAVTFLAGFFGFSNVERFVFLIMSGAPVAVSSYTMAANMGGDGELAGQFVFLSTLVSLGTLFAFIFVYHMVGFVA